MLTVEALVAEDWAELVPLAATATLDSPAVTASNSRLPMGTGWASTTASAFPHTSNKPKGIFIRTSLSNIVLETVLLPSRSKNAYFESYKISAKPREIKACGILQSGRFMSEKGVNQPFHHEQKPHSETFSRLGYKLYSVFYVNELL
jgi:hypothetical protein